MRKVERGEAQVVVGARSAVFALSKILVQLLLMRSMKLARRILIRVIMLEKLRFSELQYNRAVLVLGVSNAKFRAELGSARVSVFKAD